LFIGLYYFHLIILAYLENRLFKYNSLIKVLEYFNEIVNISLINSYKWLRILLKKFNICIIESKLTCISSDIFKRIEIYLFLLIIKNTIKSKIYILINVVYICSTTLKVVSSL
jgi:hypothetical protein